MKMLKKQQHSLRAADKCLKSYFNISFMKKIRGCNKYSLVMSIKFTLHILGESMLALFDPKIFL